MKLAGKPYSVATLLELVDGGGLDLQPEFQRGEVWSKPKRQLLVDSILRNWYIPPLHLVRDPEGGRLEVLDGKQRLESIVAFHSNEFPVGIELDPRDDAIWELGGMTYAELPSAYQRSFLDFKIIAFTLTAFKPEEPSELFYRLNQTAALTTGEKRNAFYGKARQQVKRIVKKLARHHGEHDIPGFSNARMGWDDTIARLCCAIENGGLLEKVTAAELDSFYRSEDGFKKSTAELAVSGVDFFAESLASIADPPRFNKATMFSWLYFSCTLVSKQETGLAKDFGQFISTFESQRQEVKSGLRPDPALDWFNDRAAARVSDVSSVLIRDWVIWDKFVEWQQSRGARVPNRPRVSAPKFKPLSPPKVPLEADAQEQFAATLLSAGWGRIR